MQIVKRKLLPWSDTHISVPLRLELHENGHVEKMQPQIDNYEGNTVIRKRSNDGFYRMNHLTRLGDFDTEYEHGILRRGKRTSLLPSKYLMESIQDFKDDLDERVALLKESGGLEDEGTNYYN